MRWAIGLLHYATGLAYLFGVGLLSWILLWRARLARDWEAVAFFAGLVGMALFFCSGHHIDQGVHDLLGWQDPTVVDLVTVSVALPFGAVWLFWNTGAVTGWWRGDWLIPGRYNLPVAVLVAEAVYCSAVLTELGVPGRWTAAVVAQVGVAALYLVIGAQWWAGQFVRRFRDRVWSAKGCVLGLIWPTCAMNHLASADAVASGLYRADWHLWLDFTGWVPALYFVVLIDRLRRQSAGTAIELTRREAHEAAVAYEAAKQLTREARRRVARAEGRE